ncbi:MAG: CBS domain-containing protein [Alphaproteobacteria bacterium]|jgi:CBS domain-containing protein|nr:CBS domain-containing protein [Rhodospirillaceae bacterium]MDP6404671.1 CBS domain-containing protein [Alphaproteobacteria bacterium]MDP6622156.1 CBS domain-containing protein [Alphaproteobacteria bacterium]|tara:strand:+ start:567 stop:1040 length:474 start_codon:yes stop_codon:yes gene_type:complete
MHRKIIPDLVESEHPKGNGRVCCLRGDTAAREAAVAMMETNVAAVAVIGEDDRLVGIVTERDLTRRVMASQRDPEKVMLSEIMTANPQTLRPGDAAMDALTIMRDGRYRHLPVVDDDGFVVAMISIRHIYAAVKLELEEDVRLRDQYISGESYGARA